MGNPRGFIEISRKISGNRPVEERIHDYSEVEQTLNEDDRKLQASRCMDCGIPFCQWSCPVMNNMPEWQDAIYRGNWQEAIDILQVTNNFPEFTGRICPAPCEHGCVLNIHEEPVTIRENEAAVSEQAFAKGFIKPKPPKELTGKKVAVIGSGPSGMACADLLNKAGHSVTLFEKDEAVGGLLRFGIPDFKLGKQVIDRRLKVLMEEGLEIKTNTHVGVDISADKLLNDFDVICLAVGAMKPRDLPVEGRDLEGVHFAMEFLTQQNRAIEGKRFSDGERILATGKNVVVIGGGDTGSDCVGTSNRQKANSVTQLEIMPQPPLQRSLNNPWPYWAKVHKTTSSHEEGCDRNWNVATKRFIGENGKLKQIEVVDVEWVGANGKMQIVEKEETRRLIDAELVLLSMGFVHCVHEGLLDDLGLEYDERGNIRVNDNRETNKAKVFAAGDAIRGASLVVHAIAEGRKMAENVHQYLMKEALIGHRI